MLYDKPGQSGYSKKRQQERADLWAQYMREKDKKVMTFAQNWAEWMEAYLSGNPRGQVRHIADQAFIEAGGEEMRLSQAKEALDVLVETWYLGTSLKQWAKQGKLF